MDIVSLAILAFIALVGIVLLGKLLGHIVGAVAIIFALINDLSDLGFIHVEPATGWFGDVITFIAIALAFRSPASLIALLDLIPGLTILPLHTTALLMSWLHKRRKEKYARK